MITLQDLPEHLRQQAARLIGKGLASQQDVDDAIAFMEMLAQDELAGRISYEQAQDIIKLFATFQAAKGMRS